MKAAIEVLLTSRPLERVESEIAVAGFFADDRPLRSGAARADWRLCGGLSRRIESGDLSGATAVSVVLLLISVGILFAFHAVNRWSTRHGRHD